MSRRLIRIAIAAAILGLAAAVTSVGAGPY